MNTFAQDIQDSLCQLTGELLIASGYVSAKQLEAAFAQQKTSHHLIGQILVEQGVLTQAQLAQVLQQQLKQKLSTNAPLRRQIGEILLARHAVSRWQLARALTVQNESAHNSLRVGEILVDLGFTSRGHVEQALSDQSVATSQNCDACCQHKRRTLGELLLQANKVTPEVLEQALQKQQESHAFLGEVLLSEGILSEGELEDTLAIQLLLQEVKHNLVQPLKKRLGEILVDTHQITAQQLDAVVQEQEQAASSSPSLRRKLGDLLLEKGLLPLKELKRALRLQKRLATLAMASLMGATLLSACGTPRVPEQILNTQRLAQLQTQSLQGNNVVGLHVPFSKDSRWKAEAKFVSTKTVHALLTRYPLCVREKITPVARL